MMKSITREFEMMNKLPFKARCIMAKEGKITLDRFAKLSGMTQRSERPVLRRIFNDLVKEGFAKKRKSGRHSRSRIYISIPENETEQVKQFVNSNETYYFSMDMYEFLNCKKVEVIKNANRSE